MNAGAPLNRELSNNSLNSGGGGKGGGRPPPPDNRSRSFNDQGQLPPPPDRFLRRRRKIFLAKTARVEICEFWSFGTRLGTAGEREATRARDGEGQSSGEVRKGDGGAPTRSWMGAGTHAFPRSSPRRSSLASKRTNL